MFKHISLFAGCGGFDVAVRRMGGQTVFATDNDPAALTVCGSIRPPKGDAPNRALRLCDVRDLRGRELPEADILTAGFPCQPFSVAGKRQGVNDPRGTLFWAVTGLIREMRYARELARERGEPVGRYATPPILLFENVKNLVRLGDGRTFARMLAELDDLGYRSQWSILNATSFGLPQNRERVYLVAFSGDWYDDDVTAGFFADVPPPTPPSLRNFVDFDNDPCRSVRNCRPGRKNGACRNPWHAHQAMPEPGSRLAEAVKAADVPPNALFQYRRHYVRVAKSGVCPTLTANMGGGGWNVPMLRLPNGGFRQLSPAECFALQGFDLEKDFTAFNRYRSFFPASASKLYKMAGNAVAVPCAEWVMRRALARPTRFHGPLFDPNS